jgi:hypothetical protein
MVCERQRVHAPSYKCTAGQRRGVSGVLNFDFAIRMPADVHQHAKDHRQKDERKNCRDTDCAALIVVKSLAKTSDAKSKRSPAKSAGG